METNLETQCFSRLADESLFEMAYRRLLDFYCPLETRYLRLMQRYPNLKEVVLLKNIASFLGVILETVSHIRKNIIKRKVLKFFKAFFLHSALLCNLLKEYIER